MMILHKSLNLVQLAAQCASLLIFVLHAPEAIFWLCKIHVMTHVLWECSLRPWVWLANSVPMIATHVTKIATVWLAMIAISEFSATILYAVFLWRNILIILVKFVWAAQIHVKRVHPKVPALDVIQITICTTTPVRLDALLRLMDKTRRWPVNCVLTIVTLAITEETALFVTKENLDYFRL